MTETWTAEDTSLTYLGNLTGLIGSVRAEMFDASQAGTWQCKEEIPVVVVQIGHWPQYDRAKRVREAQTQYCAGDPKAELVIMEDLSRNYHFDAPSFLIGGHRIAQAYQAAAQASVTCPLTLAPSFSPTQPPTSALSISSSPSQPSLTSTQWYMNWDLVICRQICEGSSPLCGGPAYSWSMLFESAKACCDEFFSRSPNYADLCLAASTT